MAIESLDILLRGEDLGREGARDLMHAVMGGRMTPALLAAHLVALRLKGETAAEITGFAEAMRTHAVAIPAGRPDLVDTCGTGGDRSGTFNISTAAALVAAALGAGVAKHGNRAVSSRSGSADVLEALGVVIDLQPEQVGRLIDTVGVGFLFAPRLHPAMKHAMPVRRELGVRTVFNLLGPLTNPAGVRRQVMGVYDPGLCEPVCRALGELGAERAFVVHGHGGLDEVSPCGPTRVAELRGSTVRMYEFMPQEAGLDPVPLASLAGGTAAENAALIREIFGGGRPRAAAAVILNAAFAAVAGGVAADAREGAQLARRALVDGSALAKLEELVAVSGGLAREESA